MKFLFIALLTSFASFQAPLADKPAYRLFNKAQKEVAYREVVAALSKADVVLIGELHNNPICHWLELEFTKDLYVARKGDLVLGAEMFEADNQTVLNEYLKGLISASQLEKEAKVWNNYVTDYKPLVDFAAAKNLPFIATNVPRRYASMVAKNDLSALERLSPEAMQWIVPLPLQVDLTLPGYAAMTSEMGGTAHGGAQAASMAKAQALKDATMAHFILQHRKEGRLFIHYNGSYHSDNYEGIVWYLKKQAPSLTIATISSVEQEDIGKIEKDQSQSADFTLCIPASMTKTY